LPTLTLLGDAVPTGADVDGGPVGTYVGVAVAVGPVVGVVVVPLPLLPPQPAASASAASAKSAPMIELRMCPENLGEKYKRPLPQQKPLDSLRQLSRRMRVVYAESAVVS
jgi:hypothetical protein